MNRTELIGQITGFDPDFFAPGLGNAIKLQKMPEYALNDLALILQAAEDKKNTAILPPRPQNNKNSSIIVRIDQKGKMTLNECGTPEFGGIVYKAEGIVSEGKLGLEQVKFYPTRQKSNLSAVAGKSLLIQSGTVINDYKTTASYSRKPNGKLEFDHAFIEFPRLSRDVSGGDFIYDALQIPAEGPAKFKFNGNCKQEAEIPADDSKQIEIKPFPFKHLLGVKRSTGQDQIRIDIRHSIKHEEAVLKFYDNEDTLSFSVLTSSLRPETPPSGTIQIDLSSIETGEVSSPDDIAMALHALAPAEIFDSGT